MDWTQFPLPPPPIYSSNAQRRSAWINNTEVEIYTTEIF